MIKVSVTILLFAASIGFAEDRIPASVLGSWVQSEVKADADRVRFDDDGFFYMTVSRQVGSEQGPIPFPTVCRLTQAGLITKTTHEAESFTISYEVTRVEIVADAGKSPDCEK